MNKVISLKKINLKKRRKITKNSKPYVDIKASQTVGIFNIAEIVFSIVSVLVGSLFYLKYPIINFNTKINSYVNLFQTGNFFNIVKVLFLIDFIFIFLCLFLGTNLFGNFIVGIIPAVKTFASGYTGAMIYNQFKLNGVLFSLIFLVPYFSLTSTLLIRIAKESFDMSSSISNRILQRKTAKEIHLQLFLVRIIILAFADLLIVLINSLLLSSFGGKISLQ